MVTAHSKQSLLDAHARLAGMFRKVDKIHPVYNAGGEIVGQRGSFEFELEMLQSGDIECVRKWARNYRPWPCYHIWPSEEIRSGLKFLSSAYECVDTVEVKAPIEYHEGGEYAGDNTFAVIRAGKYPVIRCRRYGGDSEDTTYALVTVDGVNIFANRIGSHLSVKKTQIVGERRMYSTNHLSGV